MGKVFRALYSEIRGLHQSAYILAFFSIASQVLALVRDRLFAHHFGASAELDVYYAAFRIPDLLFVLFASVLSVYVLIPYLSKRTEEGDEKGAQELLSTVLNAFLVAYGLTALCVALGADSVTRFFFPGFTGVHHTELVLLLRILLLQPLLLGASSLCSVVTQLGQRFVLFAVSPVLYNGGIIFGILVLYPLFGLMGVVWGVVCGAFLHMLVQVPFVVRHAYAPRVFARINLRLLGSVLVNSMPRALTLSLNQIIFLAFAGVASSMAEGSVSVFQFAQNLESVPLSIIGVSYSVAAFPVLAHLYSKGDHTAFVLRVETTLRHLVFWLVPITGLIVVLRAQVVRIVLGSGAFNWGDTRLTAATLALFALSLVAQSVNLLIVRAFYAGGNTRTPFRVTVISTCATLALSLALYVSFVAFPSFAHVLERLLRVEGVRGTEIMMLPLGYSIVQIFHALYLLLVFARTYHMPRRALGTSVLHACIATLGGCFVSYIVLNTVVSGVRTETFTGIFVQGFLSALAGGVMIVTLLYQLGSTELRELWITFRRRPLVVRLFGPDEIDSLAH